MLNLHFQLLYLLLISVGVGVISGFLVVFIMWLERIQKEGEEGGNLLRFRHENIQNDPESEVESEKEYYQDEDGEVFQLSANTSDKNLNFKVISIFFLIPIMAYMIAEGFHSSGVIAIYISGIILSYNSMFYLNKPIYPLLISKERKKML